LWLKPKLRVALEVAFGKVGNVAFSKCLLKKFEVCEDSILNGNEL
jgi:hypothetical protein